MTVYYYTNLSFPNGAMASGNRVRLLARCLVTKGVKVIVLSAFADGGEVGCFEEDGVEFRSFCRARTGLMRHLTMCFAFPFCAALFLWKKRKKGDILYSYTGHFVQRIWAAVMAKLLGLSLYYEGCEFPYSIIAGWPKLLQWLDVWIIRHCVSGVVVITPALVEYYRGITRPGTKIIEIPMTVDCARFDLARANGKKGRYIAYTGAMNRKGGGVEVLVKAFSTISAEYPDLRLVLIGKGSESRKRELLECLAPDDESRERIRFLFSGMLSTGEMAEYISGATILAMLPLPTKQQEGCFPTKLGEYLASGVPAVVSRVGIASKILTDTENIRFVAPGDVSSTAAVFHDVLDHYDEARRVARRGQEFARRNFHYENFAERLYEWYVK